MKNSLLLVVAVLLCAHANAVSVSYNIVSSWKLLGSGMLTFDDSVSPTPAQHLPGGGIHYDLTVMGSGEIGNWTSSFFEYSTFESLWVIRGPGGKLFYSVYMPNPLNLSAIPAFERSLQVDMFWSRKETAAVPEIGSTLALLSGGFMALLLVRRRWGNS